MPWPRRRETAHRGLTASRCRSIPGISPPPIRSGCAPGQSASQERQKTSVEGGLKPDGRYSGQIGFLEYVTSPDVVRTRPIEIYVQFQQGDDLWIASFCPGAISAAGESPRKAIEELRVLLVFVYVRWKTAKDLPEPWAWLSPRSLGALDDHLAMRSVDA
jgi:hypothetical protein